MNRVSKLLEFCQCYTQQRKKGILGSFSPESSVEITTNTEFWELTLAMNLASLSSKFPDAKATKNC